ncbi:cupin domain-containing protein [Cupriavidus sp. 8B]
MSLPHLASGQVASVLPLGERLAKTPTTAFFKESRLEVMRLVLTAGKHMPAHAVAGPITVQCLEGEVDIGVEGAHRLLRRGDLIYLESNVMHDVTAISNASLLVTLVLL